MIEGFKAEIMRTSETGVSGEEVKKNPSAIESLCGEALGGGDFEKTAVALEQVEAIQSYRDKVKKMPFASFGEVVEVATLTDRLPISTAEKEEKIAALAEKFAEKASRFSPRVADLYLAMLAELKSEFAANNFLITDEKIGELKGDGDILVLFSGEQSWDLKLNRLQTRLVDYLAGARALDRREGKEMEDDVRKWREEELKKMSANPNPPERRNESKPGVDAMERLKAGERVPAIWMIDHAWGRYYKEQSFSVWDSKRNVWTEKEYQYTEPEVASLSGNEDARKGMTDVTLRANVSGGRWVNLPVPYTHSLHAIESNGRNYSARQDQNGDLVIYVEGVGNEQISVQVKLAPNPAKKFKVNPSKKIVVPEMPTVFSSETDAKIAEVAQKKHNNIARARALAGYTRCRIKYLAPKDGAESEKFNTAYNTHPNGFAGAVDELRQADCDVANTYFAALCAKLNIPVRHCVGHSVKGVDEKGSASINSGTGHGWSEVYDEINREWVGMDATPAGDPNLEEEEKKDKKNRAIPGNVGFGMEAVEFTDEQLEKLRKKLEERKKELGYTKEERFLAEQTGVELSEARKIVGEINVAEQTRLPNGELVTDALARLFNAIVESRRVAGSTYAGPVRRAEGGEAIIDIVRHKLGIVAGDADPLSREKPIETVREEKSIGGLDVYLIGDKSGSMSMETEEGEELWRVQRRSEYLIFSALHRFEINSQRAGLQKEKGLSVRSQGISFRGDGEDEIDLDKPLSSNFSALDKVQLWRSLGTQGIGNGDVAALSYVFEQIKQEQEEVKRRGGVDNRLRIIIACSDGGPDDPVRVQAMAEELGKLNAVVVGIGLTETARAVPLIFNNPPFSRGDIARDINDLPILVAKHVVLEAIKLFPEKARYDAKQIIDGAIAKFAKYS
jgi:hypothetical protein